MELDAALVPLRPTFGDSVFGFLSTTKLFGTPLDITLSKLAIRSFLSNGHDHDGKAQGIGFGRRVTGPTSPLWICTPCRIPDRQSLEHPEPCY